MKKMWKMVGIALLTAVLAFPAASMAAGKSDAKSQAKPPERKMDEKTFKKKLGDVAKGISNIKKQQTPVARQVLQLQAENGYLLSVILGVSEQIGQTDEELAQYYAEMIGPLADRDESLEDYFYAEELDYFSSLASQSLSYYNQIDKLAAGNKSLDSKFNSLVKQKKYQDALNIRNQQLTGEKKILTLLNQLADKEEALQETVSEIVDSLEDGTYDENEGDDGSGDDSSYGGDSDSVGGEVYDRNGSSSSSNSYWNDDSVGKKVYN